MTQRPPALLSWSSGKDSAYSLHIARAEGKFEVVGLLTTITSTFGRVSMHGVRESILEEQARQAGLPLSKIAIPSPCTNEQYEAAMRSAMEQAQARGIRHVLFGDLYLEDIRAYRETNLARVGMSAAFPLWGRDTRTLAAEMVDSGLEAILTCIDPKALPASFAGRRFDRKLLSELPPSVDPCGENGEFHTCVVAGPMLSAPLAVTVGEVVERDGFVFADVLPADSSD
jgi:uncharacterized protein (TIGR00290 family)